MLGWPAHSSSPEMTPAPCARRRAQGAGAFLGGELQRTAEGPHVGLYFRFHFFAFPSWRARASSSACSARPSSRVSFSSALVSCSCVARCSPVAVRRATWGPLGKRKKSHAKVIYCSLYGAALLISTLSLNFFFSQQR